MGAYLHLRGLAELGETSESNVSGGHLLYLSESAGTPGSLATYSGRKESNINTKISDMGYCSNFWAGQLDDVFEDLEMKTGRQDGPATRMRLHGTVQEDVRRVPKEKGLDRRGKAHSSSGKRGMIQNAYVKDRTVDNVHNDAGFQHAANVASTSGAPLDGDHGSSFTEGHIQGGGLEELGSTQSNGGSDEYMEDHSERLPDHLLIELLVRVPTRDWPAAACVKKRWAQLFKGDGLWHSALMKKWPGATSTKRWPGLIARGSSKRRYTALYVSDSLFAKDKVEGVNEVAGHVYLFLKEQLESPTPPVSYGLLHGTIIDQFLACCKTGDEAHNLASHIWIAVLDNLDESENTFHLLMRIAEEWEVFPCYPYSKSNAVQWRLFERLFTDFRDCLTQYNYFDVLTRVRNKFEMIPQTWLGY
ncbi:unnamed protein product [Calypogeia fissa]